MKWTRFKILSALALLAAALALPVKGQPFLTNGLVAYFTFSGNGNDSSGNGNNGTLFGSAAFGTDRFGNSNSCLALPGGQGVGSGVDVPSLDNLPYLPITYSVWFLLNGNLPLQSISESPLVGRGECGDQNSGALSMFTAQGQPTTNSLVYATGATDYNTLFSVPTNKWCHVVLTIDPSGTPKFYFNGTNVPGVGSTPGGQPLDFRIGAAASGGCNPAPDYFVWNGSLDDIRIYSTNLTAAQVQQLYQLESPPCSGAAEATAVVTNGFVVGANITDTGCGYTNPPMVLILGGGGSGATATAVVSNQELAQIVITATGSNYTSAPTIYIGGVPSIAGQPQSQTVNADDAVTFSVGAFGSLLNYQWSVNGSNIPGATSNSLTFTNVVQTNLGSYQVVVTNVFGAATSSVAVLSMYPFLVDPFTGLDTLWGYTNTVSVDSWGSGPLMYQWFDDGTAIGGATNSTLSFVDIQPTNSGVYTVVVSNAYGSVTNPLEQVVVQPAGISLGLSPTVTLTGVVGQVYIIQRAPNLADPNSWITLTNLTLTQPVQIWVDTNLDASLPSHPEQYYRVLPGQ